MTTIGNILDAGSIPAISTTYKQREALMISERDNETKIIVNGITKVISLVTLSLVLGFFFHSCKIDSKTVEDCNAACETSMGYMKSVTSYKCTCADRETEKKSPWLLSN